jgi:diaminopimelate epimerase
MTSSRWHAHGNVYLVSEDGTLTPELVRGHAQGTDGIVQVVRAEGDVIEIVIWNPDGSTAEMSGNGTRIAGAWLMDRSGVTHLRVVVGPRTVTVRAVGDRLYESEIGEVKVGALETVDGIALTTVDVGNPHAVVVGDPDDVTQLGPRLETHPRFPNRTNVQVVHVDSPGEVTARVWERGVGETTASGSSAVAVAAATHDEGDVVVHFPGGDLRVRLQDGDAWLTGPAEPVAGED